MELACSPPCCALSWVRAASRFLFYVGTLVFVVSNANVIKLITPLRKMGYYCKHLLASRWYQSEEYLIPEWKVLRHTGVSRARVRRSALALKRKLCSVSTRTDVGVSTDG